MMKEYDDTKYELTPIEDSYDLLIVCLIAIDAFVVLLLSLYVHNSNPDVVFWLLMGAIGLYKIGFRS